jgi:hypothetical protein
VSGYATTDRFDTLIDEVITSLQGFTLMSDQVFTLAGNITDSATTIPVDTSTIGRCVIEIDQELIYVEGCTGSNLNIPAWGRGWKGTTASAHTSGVAVFVAPVYPKSVVAREINNAIRALYPDLFAIDTMDTTVSATNWQYELPAACDRVLSVEWRWDSISGWNPCTQWEVVNSAYTTDFASGKFVSIQELLPTGALLHITYAKQPSMIDAMAYFSDTGLPTSSRDLVVLGAACRLLPWVDTSRTPAETVVSDMTDQQRPIGLAVQLAAQLRQQYKEKLQRERDALFARYPIRVHRIRG